MTQRTVRGLVCLAVLVLLAPASRAQEETGVSTEDMELTGRVVDSEGHPLAGVEIWRPAEGPAEQVPGECSVLREMFGVVV